MAVRTLSLCTGYGGIELGLRLAGVPLLAVAAVERQAYAASVLANQMARGALDACPIWDDLESFDGSSFRGCVDLVVAGFPCQGASVAGKRLGTGDKRWLWPNVWRTVADVGASLLFIENVSGLLTVNKGGAFDEIISDLAARGWIAEWDCVPAGGVGAPHIRDRVFVLAADPNGDGLQSLRDFGKLDEGERAQCGNDIDRCSVSPGWSRIVGRAAPESSFRRVDDGSSSELDSAWHERTHLHGNGVVPQAVAAAWRILVGRITK